VAITRCPPLLTILLSPERTVQDLRMLQKLTCVTEIADLEKDPVVIIKIFAFVRSDPCRAELLYIKSLIWLGVLCQEGHSVPCRLFG